MSLGIAPILLYGAGAAAAIAGRQAQESLESGRINSLLQWAGLRSTPAIPQSPSPVFGPPPAPQTAAKMTTWTPDDLWEVTVQRSQQFAKDAQYMRTQGSSAPLIQPLPGDASTSIPTSWLLLGAGAVALVLLIRK